MPASSVNPYRGINAHLHSIAQNPVKGSPTIWTSFHASHIGHIADLLNAQLPPHYIARPEQSLQIRAENIEAERIQWSHPRPDVGIFRTGGGQISPDAAEALLDEHARTVPIADMLALKITRSAVAIYEVSDHEHMGQPVTRIELLSEDNKLGSKGYAGYLSNRLIALQSGTSLIELDYLHQSASPLPGIPAYPDDTKSHAYTLCVTDMRYGHNTGSVTLVYDIDVDTPLPARVRIPLARDDSLIFDFEAAYESTFRAGRWGTNIDYAALPRNFDTYSSDDLTRIHQVMERAQTLT
jgi:hypothetical protein